MGAHAMRRRSLACSRLSPIIIALMLFHLNLHGAMGADTQTSNRARTCTEVRELYGTNQCCGSGGASASKAIAGLTSVSNGSTTSTTITCSGLKRTFQSQCTCGGGAASDAANSAKATDIWLGCPAGNYRDATTGQCSPRCASDDHVTVNGTFWNPASKACQNWKVCPAGTYISRNGTSIVDRQCTPCAAKHYSTLSNSARCAPWRNCPGGTKSYDATSPPTATRNRYCDSDCLPPRWTGHFDACCVNAYTCSQKSELIDRCDDNLEKYVISPWTFDSAPYCGNCPSGTRRHLNYTYLDIVKHRMHSWREGDKDPYNLLNDSSVCNIPRCPAEHYFFDDQNYDEIIPETPYGAELGKVDIWLHQYSAGARSGQYLRGKCVPWTTCQPGTRLSQNGTTASDRVCTPCTSGTTSYTTNAANCVQIPTCDTGKFWNSTSKACQPWTVCPAGTYVTRSGSPAVDRQCSPCGSGSFSIGINSVACTSWTTCNKGTYISRKANATIDRGCSDCAANHYSEYENRDRCQSHDDDHCVDLKVMWTPGTPTKPKSCGFCPPNQYPSVAGNYKSAQTCKDCPAGTHFSWLDKNGETTMQRKYCWPCPAGQFSSTAAVSSCTACPAGTFQVQTGQTTCTPKKTCPTGTHTSLEGTPTTDRQCAFCIAGYGRKAGTTDQCEVCTNPKFNNVVSGAPCATKSCPVGQGMAWSNSTHADCRACPSGQFSDSNTTGQCKAYTICTALQYEKTAATTTTDRVCAPVVLDLGGNCTFENSAGTQSAAIYGMERLGKWGMFHGTNPDYRAITTVTIYMGTSCAHDHIGSLNVPHCKGSAAAAAGVTVASFSEFTAQTYAVEYKTKITDVHLNEITALTACREIVNSDHTPPIWFAGTPETPHSPKNKVANNTNSTVVEGPVSPSNAVAFPIHCYDAVEGPLTPDVFLDSKPGYVLRGDVWFNASTNLPVPPSTSTTTWGTYHSKGGSGNYGLLVANLGFDYYHHNPTNTSLSYSYYPDDRAIVHMKFTCKDAADNVALPFVHTLIINCQLGKYRDASTGRCLPWRTCPAGTYVSRNGTSTMDRQCTDGDEGEDNDDDHDGEDDHEGGESEGEASR